MDEKVAQLGRVPGVWAPLGPSVLFLHPLPSVITKGFFPLLIVSLALPAVTSTRGHSVCPFLKTQRLTKESTTW